MIFLQKSLFGNLNINMHDLKEKKPHYFGFFFNIMLSTDKREGIMQQLKAHVNKIEICSNICHLRELLTLWMLRRSGKQKKCN